MLQKKNTVIVIAGPTAVGKTAVAVQAAKYFNTEIISADSRQCFHELNIGVARPSPEELAQAKHHFIASHSVYDDINAAYFEKYALEKVKEIFQKKNIAVMAGGTGLYIKAFCEGLDEVPTVPEEIRNTIVDNYREKGIEWLRREIEYRDPLFYQQGEIKNPQRMMRALEVKEATGKSIIEYRKRQTVQRDFNIIKIALELPKDALHENINARTDRMMEAGLPDEVKILLPFSHLNALQTVGYKEIFDFLNGVLPLETAVDLIKQNTRLYAKRQMTWFRKDKAFKWFAPNQVEVMIEYLQMETASR